MLALRMYEDSRCPSCGGNLAETAAAENEDAYVHEPPLTCARCVAFARAAEAYNDQRHPQALIHLVSPHPKRRR